MFLCTSWRVYVTVFQLKLGYHFVSKKLQRTPRKNNKQTKQLTPCNDR